MEVKIDLDDLRALMNARDNAEKNARELSVKILGLAFERDKAVADAKKMASVIARTAARTTDTINDVSEVTSISLNYLK